MNIAATDLLTGPLRPSGFTEVQRTGLDLGLATLLARIRAVWQDPADAARDRQLCRALIDFCCDTEAPTALLRVHPDSYRRVELVRDDQQGWRLLALVWARGQGTPIHGHGGRPAHEAVWVGELLVEEFEETLLHDGRALLGLLSRESFPAAEARISPRHESDIHRCLNAGEDVCISLHLLPIDTPPQIAYRLCSDGAFERYEAAPEQLERLGP